MIGKRVNSSEDVPLYKVKDLLKEKSKEGELSYEQNLTYDYVKKFGKITPAKAEKLLEELKKVDGMDDKTAIKILDILPKEEEKLKLLVPKDSTMDESKLKEILELVTKYGKK